MSPGQPVLPGATVPLRSTPGVCAPAGAAGKRLGGRVLRGGIGRRCEAADGSGMIEAGSEVRVR
jgi:hypothetical protein